MSKTNFTVAELITELQKLPLNLPVVVSGYDSGYEDFYHPLVLQVSDNPDEWYTDGRFQQNEKSELKVVALIREKRDD